MSRHISDELTAMRRAWLVRLRDEGPASSRNVVGYACRKNGWTEWFVTTIDGRSIPISQLYAKYSKPYLAWEQVVGGGPSLECITDAGRAALEKETP